MENTSILAYLAVVTIMVLTPGQTVAAVLHSVAAHGSKNGFATVLGVALAYYVHTMLTVAGLALLLKQYPVLFPTLQALGAGYLIYLGTRQLRKTWCLPGSRGYGLVMASTARKTQGLQLSMFEGFMTSLLNPHVLLFYFSVFPQFIRPDESIYARTIFLVTMHALFAISWYSALIMGFAYCSERRSEHPWIRTLAPRMVSVVLIAYGSTALVQSFSHG